MTAALRRGYCGVYDAQVAPGGGVLLIEPYYGPVASVVFKRLFASEDFDTTMPGWRNDATEWGASI